MTIEANKVVQMHYTLKDEQGNVLDSSEGRDPMAYIHGIGNIIPGLEKEMEGKVAGDSLVAVISPEDGYGTRKDDLVHIVPLSGFQSDGDEKLAEGMQVQVETNQGMNVATVAKIDGDDVSLDLNHPLAGVTLHFDVEVVSVREAEKEELEHGHAHGVGGHNH